MGVYVRNLFLAGRSNIVGSMLVAWQPHVDDETAGSQRTSFFFMYLTNKIQSV